MVLPDLLFSLLSSSRVTVELGHELAVGCAGCGKVVVAVLKLELQVDYFALRHARNSFTISLSVARSPFLRGTFTQCRGRRR